MRSALSPVIGSALLATRRILAGACTASLISACALTNGRTYLTGSEIEGLLIGDGSVVRRPMTAGAGEPSADRWKETFLPGPDEEKEGRILGRGRFDSPWTGRWWRDGDSICVDWREQSMDDRAAEVAAAMDYLTARADVDPERIGLYGGSQAGWVVPKVAARREVAFVICQSCPVDDGMSQELYVVESVLDLAEAKQQPWYAKLERPPTAAEAWFLAPETGVVSGPVSFRDLDPKMFEFGRRAFADDAPPRLEDLRSPLLVLYGTRDIVVDWRLGSSAYRSLPEATGNDDVTVVLFEGADHTLMQPDHGGGPRMSMPPDEYLLPRFASATRVWTS